MRSSTVEIRRGSLFTGAPIDLRIAIAIVDFWWRP
jgi:hypothetical protein